MKSNDNFQVETITGGKANAALIIIPGARSALLMLVFSPSDQVLLFSYFLHQISAIVGFQQGCSPRPAEKRAAPPRLVKSKPCPAPQKLTKPAERNGAKLTVDYTDYAHTFGLRVGQ